MSGRIEARLRDLAIVLPEPASPVANYVPARISGGQLLISGQLPVADGKPHYSGRLGAEVSVEDGNMAARLCALNVLAQARAALDGDLDRIAGCLRLCVYVAATPDFTSHPQVANGASDVMVEVLGDAGRHARAAVGTASLPLGVPVEVEALFELI